MIESRAYGRVFFDPEAVLLLPRGNMRTLATEFAATVDDQIETSLVVAMASTILSEGGDLLPDWIDPETRYLVVVDVPEQAVLRLPSILRLHKPHHRLHISRDSEVVKRLLIAHSRPYAWEGILDAYVLGNTLIVVLGDMTVREFPKDRLPKIHGLAMEAFEDFELDTAGSFLYWRDRDIHLGVSQLLQAVDPVYLTEIEIQRYALEKVSLAVFDMRTERGFRQTEIPGLSDRHVRRLENEEVRLTVDASEKLAAAFGLDLAAFLSELSQRVTALNDRERGLEASSLVAGVG